MKMEGLSRSERLIRKIRSNLMETTSLVTDTISKLLARGELLSSLNNRTQRLINQSQTFEERIERARYPNGRPKLPFRKWIGVTYNYLRYIPQFGRQWGRRIWGWVRWIIIYSFPSEAHMREAYTVERQWWDQHNIIELSDGEKNDGEYGIIYFDVEKRDVYHNYDDYHTKIT